MRVVIFTGIAIVNRRESRILFNRIGRTRCVLPNPSVAGVPISQKKSISSSISSWFKLLQFLRQAKMVQSALFQISSGFFPPIFFDLSEVGKVLCEFTSYFIHPNMHMITDNPINVLQIDRQKKNRKRSRWYYCHPRC